MQPLHAIILIDALGWEVARCHGFLDYAGVRRVSLATVLGYSSAAIPSLLSGTAPSRHGCWTMYRRAGDQSPFRFLRGLPRVPHPVEWRARRFVRRWIDRRGLIKGYYDLYEIPLHLLSRFDVAQHQDPYEPGGLGEETIFDWLVERHVPYALWTYRTPEAENMEDAVRRAEDRNTSVLFFYTAELDALMHRVGIHDAAVNDKLRCYERFIGRLQTAAGRAGRNIFVHVFSDHGMTPVTRSVDVIGGLARRGFRLGGDYVAFFDSTMVRIWGDQSVARAAEDAFAGQGRLLTDDELRRCGCFFPGREYGDWIVLANPGVMVAPSFMGAVAIAGMHGYDPDDSYSPGVFLTTASAERLPRSILDVKNWLAGAIEADSQ